MKTVAEKRAQHVEYMRRYRLKHPDRREEGRKYWENNKETILVKRKEKPRTDKDREYQRKYQQVYRKNHPDKPAAATKKWYKNGGKEVLRAAKIKRQELKAGRPKPDCCDICGRGNRKIAFDHCHKTGKFRGWLCVDCNVLLGLAEDSVERLEKLMVYLKTTL